MSFINGSFLFGLWRKPPVQIYVQVYLFNVTNPREFLRGQEKLRVEEVGPFVYRCELSQAGNTLKVSFHLNLENFHSFFSVLFCLQRRVRKYERRLQRQRHSQLHSEEESCPGAGNVSRRPQQHGGYRPKSRATGKTGEHSPAGRQAGRLGDGRVRGVAYHREYDRLPLLQLQPSGLVCPRGWRPRCTTRPSSPTWRSPRCRRTSTRSPSCT